MSVHLAVALLHDHSLAKNADFMAKLNKTGLYSDNHVERADAQLTKWIKDAIHGDTYSLNMLWARVKSREMLETDYQLIKALYNGANGEITLSNGQTYTNLYVRGDE